MNALIDARTLRRLELQRNEWQLRLVPANEIFDVNVPVLLTAFGFG